MRLLDRYLLRELLIPFGYCLSGFLIFWISSDLLTELDDFQRQKLQALDVVQYYAIRTPELVVLVLPVAFLLALLYALTNHARHHELTAIRAAGVSLWRLALPYALVGLFLSLGVLALNEWFVPDSLMAAERVLERRQPATAARASRQWEPKVAFTNTRENRKWFIAAFNRSTFELANPHVEWILPDGSRRVMMAERAAWTPEGWVFTNYQETVYPPGRGTDPGPLFQTNVLLLAELTETPDQIRSEIKVGRTGFKEARRTQFSIREVLDYKRLHSDLSEKVVMMDTTLHARLAGPWTCLVVVAIALPFGARSGRRNVFVGVASSIVICFGYFVLQQLMLALGLRGLLPPWLAAWAPNVLFAAAGLGLSWRIR